MDKRLTRIGTIVDFESDNFFNYLDRLLAPDIKEAINRILEKTQVYLFSGLIRNYFLAILEYRDVDVVLKDEVDIYEIFKDYNVIKNSFGGFKIMLKSGPMDLWFIEDTWAFKHSKQKALSFHLEQIIPNTVFFNFSSIIFCINSRNFFYTDFFLKFLMNRELDYVEAKNPNYGLCIINTIYYSQKYKLKVSKRLGTLVKKLYEKGDYDYDQIQIKHFGKLIYSQKLIQQKISKFEFNK